MAKETIEEYLKRGGKIQKFEYIKPEEEEHTIKTNSFVNVPGTMSIVDGELFFSVKKGGKKLIPNTKFINMVSEDPKIPNDVLDRITNSLRRKNEGT